MVGGCWCDGVCLCDAMNGPYLTLHILQIDQFSNINRTLISLLAGCMCVFDCVSLYVCAGGSSDSPSGGAGGC